MALNEVYNDIAKKLGVPASKRVTNILEAYFSPEEGEAVLQLFDPSTCQEVASRMGVDEKKVFPILEIQLPGMLLKKVKPNIAFTQT
jgi:hypothetical protein